MYIAAFDVGGLVCIMCQNPFVSTSLYTAYSRKRKETANQTHVGVFVVVFSEITF